MLDMMQPRPVCARERLARDRLTSSTCDDHNTPSRRRLIRRLYTEPHESPTSHPAHTHTLYTQHRNTHNVSFWTTILFPAQFAPPDQRAAMIPSAFVHYPLIPSTFCAGKRAFGILLAVKGTEPNRSKMISLAVAGVNGKISRL